MDYKVKKDAIHRILKDLGDSASEKYGSSKDNYNYGSSKDNSSQDNYGSSKYGSSRDDGVRMQKHSLNKSDHGDVGEDLEGFGRKKRNGSTLENSESHLEQPDEKQGENEDPSLELRQLEKHDSQGQRNLKPVQAPSRATDMPAWIREFDDDELTGEKAHPSGKHQANTRSPMSGNQALDGMEPMPGGQRPHERLPGHDSFNRETMDNEEDTNTPAWMKDLEHHVEGEKDEPSKFKIKYKNYAGK